MRLGILLPVLLLAALVACDDPTGGSTPISIIGSWTGSTAGVNVTMTLSGAGSTVSGSGSVSGPGGNLAMQVSGTRAFNDLTLTITFEEDFEPATFTGTVQSSTTISGTLDGSGFDNDALTLTKQELTLTKQ